jgi:hypothetical protein
MLGFFLAHSSGEDHRHAYERMVARKLQELRNLLINVGSFRRRRQLFASQ